MIAVEVGVDEVQARRRAPVAEQARLDVLGLQRLAEQRIVEQIDLADGEIVGRAPVAVYEFELREVGFGCSILQNRCIETS